MTPPLDDLGRQQAAAAAAWLGSVDRVIASPLQRAQQTAGAFGVDVETDERFIELNYGEWEGRPVGDVPAETWQAWRSDLDFRPPSGETLNELGTRVRTALDELVAQAERSNIVVVSHVSPIKAAVAWALDVTDQATWRTRLGQAAICQIGVNAGVPQLIEFNTTAHLKGLG